MAKKTTKPAAKRTRKVQAVPAKWIKDWRHLRWNKGIPAWDIAAEYGVAVTSVYRHTKNGRKSTPKDVVPVITPDTPAGHKRVVITLIAKAADALNFLTEVETDGAFKVENFSVSDA